MRGGSARLELIRRTRGSFCGFIVTLIHSALSINKSQWAKQQAVVHNDDIVYHSSCLCHVLHLLYDVLNTSSSVCVLSVLAKPLCLWVVVHYLVVVVH